MFILEKARLLDWLIEHQQSPVDLARQTNLCTSTVARWLRANSPVTVHVKSVGKLARVFGADLQRIIKQKEDSNPDHVTD